MNIVVLRDTVGEGIAILPDRCDKNDLENWLEREVFTNRDWTWDEVTICINNHGGHVEWDCETLWI